MPFLSQTFEKRHNELTDKVDAFEDQLTKLDEVPVILSDKDKIKALEKQVKELQTQNDVAIKRIEKQMKRYELLEQINKSLDGENKDLHAQINHDMEMNIAMHDDVGFYDDEPEETAEPEESAKPE